MEEHRRTWQIHPAQLFRKGVMHDAKDLIVDHELLFNDGVALLILPLCFLSINIVDVSGMMSVRFF